MRKRAVLRIHDLSVWIPIRRSMPLTNESGSCYFRHWPSRCQQKTNLKKVFCLLLFEGTFTSFSKIKSKKKSHSSRNRRFSYYFCLVIEGSGSRRPRNMWIRIRMMCCKAAGIVRNVFQTFEKGRKFFQGKCKHRVINLKFARVIIFMSKR